MRMNLQNNYQHSTIVRRPIKIFLEMYMCSASQNSSIQLVTTQQRKKYYQMHPSEFAPRQNSGMDDKTLYRWKVTHFR